MSCLNIGKSLQRKVSILISNETIVKVVLQFEENWLHESEHH